MASYEYILFDLDGTLTDSAEGIINAVRYTLDHYGIEEGDYQSFYRFIGPPMQDSFQMFYDFSEEKAKEAVAVYREYYGEKGLFENRVYDGIEQLLEKLKEDGKTLLVATSKPQSMASKILRHFNLDGYFDFIGGATMDGRISTKAQVISHVLESFNVSDIKKVVMVGDRHHDVDGAKVLGLDCIGVLYGYGSRQEFEECGADYIAETVEDILKFV